MTIKATASFDAFLADQSAANQSRIRTLRASV